MKKIEYIERYGEEWYEEHVLKHNKQWREDNPNYGKQYYQDNKEKHNEQNKQWKIDNPILYRANNLLNAYRQSDKNANRGECTLTVDWIVNNIFTSKCVFCGEDDWSKLGCDRIDNSKPHTVDNVKCCCYKCNNKRGVKSLEEFLEQIKKPQAS